MSTTYSVIKLDSHFRKKESPIPSFRNSGELHLTVFFAGESYGLGVQLTLTTDEFDNGKTAHFCLTEKQAKDLASELMRPWGKGEISDYVPLSS